MKKFLKYAGIAVGAALLLLVALALFVQFYLTDERVKSLLLPRLEQTLGRQVVMDNLEVGLFRGITAENFAVKEKGGAEDFFRAKEFVLRYELLPLFRGRLIITKAILLEPFIRIERDRQGRFNFETLAVLEKTPEEQPAKEQGPVALPLALTIDQIAVEDARFVVKDQLGDIPAVDGSGNVSISVKTEERALVYSGRYQFRADVAYEELKPQIAGQGEFNPQTVTYQVDTTIDDQTVHLEGAAENWQKVPQVRLDVSAKQLDLDRLLALMGGGAQAASPRGKKTGTPPSKAQPAEPLSAALPPGMTASGTINIEEALYRNMKIQELTASYQLKEGILRVDDFTARAADGKIVGSSRIDLTRPEPSFAAAMKTYSLQAGELATLLAEQYGSWLTGHLTSSVELTGSGTAWPQIQKALAVKADYTVRDGQLREFPITAAIAELLDTPELRSPSFQNLTGKLRVEQGQVLLDSVLTGQDLQAKIVGTVGLNGQLNLPVALRLSGPLARKIKTRTSLAQYLTDAEEGVAIDFKLGGTVSRPRPQLDLGAAGERLQEQVEKKALQEIDRFLQKKAPPPEQAPEQQEGAQPAQQPPVQDFLKDLLGR